MAGASTPVSPSPSPPREEDDTIKVAAPAAVDTDALNTCNVGSPAATDTDTINPAPPSAPMTNANDTASVAVAPRASQVSPTSTPSESKAANRDALRRSPRLAAQPAASPPVHPRASPSNQPAPANHANEIVSPRSPRIANQRGSVSFRQLLREVHVMPSDCARPAAASPAASGGRRQSTRPATVAARSQSGKSHLEDLFNDGLSSDDDEAADEGSGDVVYKEENVDADSDDEASASRNSCTSTSGKRKRTATRASRLTRHDDVDKDDELTDSTSASTASVQSRLQCVVQVPEPQRYHANWKKWDVYFKVYCSMTHQKIVIEETKNRQWRLDRIRASKVYRDLQADNREDEFPLPPKEFDIFQRLYVCTHGGKTKKTRGKNQRVRRHLRFYGCGFRFIVQVVQIEDLTWCLEVRLGIFEHNHRVSREVFRTYPDERGVIVDKNVQQVQTMIDVRAKRSKIYDFLVARREHDNDATAIQLAEFAAQDRNNLVTVDESHRGHSAVISMTTALMRATYARFPELLLIDCTHKTNRYNYQLCTFMVVDESGEGGVVQHSLFETNSDWNMEAALAHFARAHPSAENSLRVIVVDKDLNEIRVLHSRFPQTRILICTFHVVKYFGVAVKKPEYGCISPEDRQKVEYLLKNLVHASSAEVYDQEHRSLKLLCERVHFTEFYEYYKRNWHSCQPMWVQYLRAKLPYFRVNTNNHLESFFGKIKEIVTPDMSMAECLKELIAKERTRQNDFNYFNNRVGTYVNRNYDEELSTVLRFTTHFVAENVAKEYDIARTKAADYQYLDTGDYLTVKGAKHARDVNTVTWMCPCDFAVAMELPCRHSIAARIHLGLKPLIPLERIGIRWSRLQVPVPQVRQFTYNTYEHRQKVMKQHTARERFHEAWRRFQPIVSEISELTDDEEYAAAIQFVEDAWMNVRMRKRVKVSAEDETSDAEPATQPSAGVSLTQNSLYSVEIGDVPIMNTASIQLAKPVSQLASTQTQPDDQDVAQPADPDDEDDDFERPVTKRPQPRFNINLNPRATRPGRPKSSRAQDAAETRQSRQVFNNTMKARRALGENTMKQLLDSLDEEKPGLAEVKRRLDAISVRHLEHKKGKVDFVRKPSSTMVNDPFYTLPRATLEKCFKVLPLSNNAEDAISISSQTYSQEAADPSAVVEAVKIGSGRHTLFYSRAMVEVMQRVNLLKDAADNGLGLVRWLERDVASVVPSAIQPEVLDLARQVSTVYPACTLPGLGSDFHYSMLPCIKPPAWFNDGVIRAFCERLSSAWPKFKATRVVELADPDKKRTRSKPMTPYMLSTEVEHEIEEFGTDASVRVIGIPVSFNNIHWCCMIVHKDHDQITTYDSLGGNKTQAVMAILADKIEAIIHGKSFIVKRVESPVQSDGYSCGFFVCYKLWCQVDAKLSRDLSPTGQLTLRFHMLKLIMHGSSAARDDTQ